MNIDNDYDNDGNNIVPCPICLDVYCPSKENGKCPEEDMFALEGEIRMLLDEYKATDDNSRIANVLEAVEKILHHQLQKTREEFKERIDGLFGSRCFFVDVLNILHHIARHNAEAKAKQLVDSLIKGRKLTIDNL